MICSTCQERLREIDEYILLMKRGTEKLEMAKSRARKHAPFGIRVWLGAGAMAAVALALFVMVPRAPKGSPSEVQLVAFRGEQMAHTVAGRKVDLMIDVSDLAPSRLYRVEVVDAGGREEWSGQATASGARLLVPVSKSLKRGVHWVRLSTAEGALLREFGLRVD